MDKRGEDDSVLAGIEQLAALLSRREPLDVVLGRVATLSASAVKGASGVAVSIVARGRPTALAASDHAVHAAEQLQYALGEGPALSALAHQSVSMSGSLGGDERWPRFGSAVARSGLHSVLVAPMMLPDAVVGALSVYAADKDAFTAETVSRAQRFARPAADVIHSLHLLQQTQQHAHQLGEALKSRSVIDQAIGIIRSRNGGTAEDAFQRLRKMSNDDRTKLAEVATNIVDRSVRRAQARRPTGE